MAPVHRVLAVRDRVIADKRAGEHQGEPENGERAEDKEKDILELAAALDMDGTRRLQEHEGTEGDRVLRRAALQMQVERQRQSGRTQQVEWEEEGQVKLEVES